jgi:hypothetical protein
VHFVPDSSSRDLQAACLRQRGEVVVETHQGLIEFVRRASEGLSEHRVKTVEGWREEPLVHFREVERYAVAKIGERVAIPAAE